MMTNEPARRQEPMAEPPPSLIFEMVADIAILQAVVVGLANSGDAATLAIVRAALTKLAVSSVQAGQHVPLVKLMDDTMQRRIVAFEAKLPRQDRG